MPGIQYVLGGDMAGGGAGADPCVASVIRADNCALAAVWRDLAEPVEAGRILAFLGWKYHEALMAIETYPSAHGLPALHQAISMGYRRVYLRQNYDKATKSMTDKLGWRTDGTTKPIMISRVKEALGDGNVIPDEAMIAQFRAQRWNKKRKMEPEPGAHDDDFDSYAIAVCVRDEAWARNDLQTLEVRQKTVDELVWDSISTVPVVQKRRMAC